MNYRDTNRLNFYLNTLSGNLFPLKSNVQREWSISSISRAFYAVFSLLAVFGFFVTCSIASFQVPLDRVLKDSGLSLILCPEVIVLVICIHCRRESTYRFIRDIDHSLSERQDDDFRNIVKATNSIQKALFFYVLMNSSTVGVWVLGSFTKVFHQNTFTMEDYPVPIFLSLEPMFSKSVFVRGMFIELYGTLNLILKKLALDVYMVHMILSMTVQYKHLTFQLQTIFRNEKKDFVNDALTKKQLTKWISYHLLIIRYDNRLLYSLDVS